MMVETMAAMMAALLADKSAVLMVELSVEGKDVRTVYKMVE